MRRGAGRDRPARIGRPALVAAFMAVLAALAGCGAGSADLGPGGATVVRVVDGDTIVVDLAGRDEKVRLIGIDTPETVDPRRPVGCFGEQASAHTKELLPPGTVVDLVRDAEERDRYGRLLAYVYRRDDGRFVNLELVRDGFANQLTIPPNVAHTDAFRAAESDARAAGRGLWGACDGSG